MTQTLILGANRNLLQQFGQLITYKLITIWDFTASNIIIMIIIGYYHYFGNKKKTIFSDLWIQNNIIRGKQVNIFNIY